MDETGKVIKVSGDDATVQFEKKAACKDCGMCFATDSERKVELTLKNGINAKVGDTVRVSSSSVNVLSSILIVYGVPLAIFFAGLLAAHFIFKNEIVTIIAGLVFLVCGFILLKHIDKQIGKAKKAALLPKIVSIEKSDEEKTKSEEDIAKLEKEIID